MADPILCAELTNDPLGRGYATMTIEERTVDINTEYRTQIKPSMTGTEIFQAIDAAEFVALATADRDLIMQFFTWESINPGGNEVVVFSAIFGGASATISNLSTARLENVSRAFELGLPEVLAVDVLECEG